MCISWRSQIFDLSHDFKMAAVTSFHTGKWCHLVSENETAVTHLCSSVFQLLIHSTFLLVWNHHYHGRQAADWSVPISTSCLHRPLSWASRRGEFSPWLSGWSLLPGSVAWWMMYGSEQVMWVAHLCHMPEKLELSLFGWAVESRCRPCVKYSG